MHILYQRFLHEVAQLTFLKKGKEKQHARGWYLDIKEISSDLR